MWDFFKRKKKKKEEELKEAQNAALEQVNESAEDAESLAADIASEAEEAFEEVQETAEGFTEEVMEDTQAAHDTAEEAFEYSKESAESFIQAAAEEAETEPMYEDDAPSPAVSVSEEIASETAAHEPAAVAEDKPEKRKGLFSKLKDGLKKTRDNIFGNLFVESEEKIDDEFYEELEEAMIISDMGMATTEKLLDGLRSRLKADGIRKRSEARDVMIELLAETMRNQDGFIPDTQPAVILIVGVNGVGKTTSIGKLASMYKQDGRNVLLAAGDTFRAAAAEQLTIWAERADVPIIKHNEGADPAAVVFDAIAAYKARKCDLLICDTAGRLHNKKNLMSELAKIRRVIERELPSVAVEVLLVLDATTGQNAIAQAKVFGENTGLTGIILTKLDGTAKGGVVVAVNDELHLPVRFVGVGEGIDDLQPFDSEAFAKALI
ncbi:MAG: signal recognition particle-docking protein FtsY [Clostridia bacterium]|nr:signal recognition particle-docking protein FtsY [Clostridia bacterium]